MCDRAMTMSSLPHGRGRNRGATGSRRNRWCIGGLLLAILCLFSGDPTCAQEISIVKRAIQAKQFDSALTTVDAAIARDSVNMPLWRLRDEIFRLRQDNAGRIATLREALHHRSGETEFRLELAEIFVDSGLVDSAALHVERVLRYTEGRSVRAHYLEGRLHELRQQPDSALVSYRRAWDLIEQQRLF